LLPPSRLLLLLLKPPREARSESCWRFCEPEEDRMSARISLDPQLDENWLLKLLANELKSKLLLFELLWPKMLLWTRTRRIWAMF